MSLHSVSYTTPSKGGIINWNPDPERLSNVDRTIQVVVCGDKGSGRFSLIKSCFEDKFQYSRPSIEWSGDSYKKRILVEDKVVDIVAYTNPDEHAFANPDRRALGRADGIIFVYDKTNQTSFNNLKNWKQVADRHGRENCPSVLVGTKCDLTDEAVVGFTRAAEWAEMYDVHFFEVSSKTDVHVKAAFETIVLLALDKIKLKPLAKARQLQEKKVSKWNLNLRVVDFGVIYSALRILAFAGVCVTAGVFFNKFWINRHG